MSMVGPRPKLPEYVTLELLCRPGITGMATIVFAREERILARVAKEHLNAYIHAVVLPAKRQLDVEYMARATFLSDLCLLVSTLLRRWDTAPWKRSPDCRTLQRDTKGLHPSVSLRRLPSHAGP